LRQLRANDRALSGIIRRRLIVNVTLFREDVDPLQRSALVPVRGFRSSWASANQMTRSFTRLCQRPFIIFCSSVADLPKTSRFNPCFASCPQETTNFDFFRFRRVTLGASIVAVFLKPAVWLGMGLNFGIDFLRGPHPHGKSKPTRRILQPYRAALKGLELAMCRSTEVF